VAVTAAPTVPPSDPVTSERLDDLDHAMRVCDRAYADALNALNSVDSQIQAFVAVARQAKATIAALDIARGALENSMNHVHVVLLTCCVESVSESERLHAARSRASGLPE
jgi:hypothetical protein